MDPVGQVGWRLDSVDWDHQELSARQAHKGCEAGNGSWWSISQACSSNSELCRTYVFANVAADVALDSLHVVVATDVAYGVPLALRECHGGGGGGGAPRAGPGIHTLFVATPTSFSTL